MLHVEGNEDVVIQIPGHPSLTDFEQIAYAQSLVGKPGYYGSKEGTIIESEYKEDGWIHARISFPKEVIDELRAGNQVSFSMRGVSK